ncbi:MAG: ATP-binding protein [Oligoflexia bacterium]|nr:ATP-binding protein [Oligoflexia bacterium]
MPIHRSPLDRIGAPLNSEPIPVLQWIEIASSLQIPSFHIVGLPGPEVAEARERVRAALEAQGFEFPRRRVVLNLSPASIRKRGTGLDLAMALAVLWNKEAAHARPLKIVAWGELGLDGKVKAAGQITRTLYACWREGISHLVISRDEEPLARERLQWIQEGEDLPGLPPVLVPVRELREAWEVFSARSPHAFEPEISGPAPMASGSPTPENESTPESFSNLLALPPSLERIVGVCASGSHHLLLLGPRGTGKSQALEWLIALQPPISPRSRLHSALLAELSGGPGLAPSAIRRVSPQTRPSALLGGANPLFIRPGEFSLAHGGLLIADELPEWPRDSREALREPLERGRVTLTRTYGSLELPARFTLAANGNLCPCGGWPPELPKPLSLPGKRLRIPRCKCTHSMRRAYLQRLSGPVLDRIDLVYIGAGAGLPEKPLGGSNRVCELFLSLQAKVRCARELTLRHRGVPAALIPASDLELLLENHPDWSAMIEQSEQQSLRARHKLLRVALSLAAWDGANEPSPAHFTEAACYRPDRFGLAD